MAIQLRINTLHVIITFCQDHPRQSSSILDSLHRLLCRFSSYFYCVQCLPIWTPRWVIEESNFDFSSVTRHISKSDLRPFPLNRAGRLDFSFCFFITEWRRQVCRTEAPRPANLRRLRINLVARTTDDSYFSILPVCSVAYHRRCWLQNGG